MIDQPRRRRSKPRSSPYVWERINADAAGIDRGSTAHFVAVPPESRRHVRRSDESRFGLMPIR